MRWPRSRCGLPVAARRSSYFLPISARWGDENLRPGAPKLSYTLAKIRHTARVGALVDGAFDERLPQLLLDAMREGTKTGDLRFAGTDALAEIGDPGTPRQLGVEQSNLSIAFSDKIILKLYRRIRSGEQPDVEVAHFLTEVAGYEHTPRYLGHLTHEGEATTVLAAAFAFVPNRGDAWTGIIDALMLELNENESWTSAGAAAEAAPGHHGYDFPLSIGKLLGQRTAELHRALATETDDPGLRRRGVDARPAGRWTSEVEAEASAMLDRLAQARSARRCRPSGARRCWISARRCWHGCMRRGQLTPSGGLSRIHGDYPSGPGLLGAERRRDHRLRGRAGAQPGRAPREILAAARCCGDAAVLRLCRDDCGGASQGQLRRHGGTRAGADRGVAAARRAPTSCRPIVSTSTGAPNLPTDEKAAQALLDLFLLQKAIYETGYELGNRPAWVGIPLSGILDLLARETT